MSRITVASGKGGTGKTTVATSLALVFSEDLSVQVLDCDVEAPNASLLLRPVIGQVDAVTRPMPVVDEAVCRHCGLCSDACRFHAIAVTHSRVLVFPDLCHGCGGCVRTCPSGAISETHRVVGEVAGGSAGAIRFAEGRLKIGSTATVQVIRAVRSRERPADVTIVDSPPGTSCPAVAAMDGADRVLLVAEPTPFGLHDLQLAVETARMLGLNMAVAVNRDGAGDNRIDRYCAEAGIPIVGRIADDRRIAEAYSRGELPIGASPAFRDAIRGIAVRLMAGAMA